MNEAWNHFDPVGLKRNAMRTEFEPSGSATDVGPIVLILTKPTRGLLRKNIHEISMGCAGFYPHGI